MYGPRSHTGRRPRDNAPVPNASIPGRTRAVTALAAAVTLAVALTACSSDSEPSSEAPGNDSVLGRAADAMADAQGTADGSMRLAAGRTTYTSRWQGTFADGRGTSTGNLPAPGRPRLDIRWTDDHVYAQRTVDPATSGTSPIFQLTAVRPGAARWVTVPASNMAVHVLAPLSPPDLVRVLSSSGKQSVSDGPKVGGATTRKVTVTDHATLLFNWAGSKDAEVLLDGQDRARRVTVTAGEEQVRVDVRYTDSAPDVEPPSAEDLETKAPAAPGPIGPFRTIRTGDAAGTTWTLQQAPGRNDTECWRWTSTPPMTVVQPNYQADTRCMAPMTPDGPDVDPADQIDFVLWTNGDGPSAVVVAHFPSDITQATLGYVGGRTETVPVTDGLLTWVYPSSEPLGYVGLERAGTPIACGVAAVSSIEDLTNDSLVADPFTAPWSCQTP